MNIHSSTQVLGDELHSTEVIVRLGCPGKTQEERFWYTMFHPFPAHTKNLLLSITVKQVPKRVQFTV